MPTAAPSRCTHPHCRNHATNRGRCDEHPNNGWLTRRKQDQRDNRSSATRNETTPSKWQRIWGQVMQTHQRICHVCHKPGADQVDHIIPVALGGAKNDPSNLAPIHAEPCHRLKTQRELRELRRLARAKRTRNQDDPAESD